MTTHRDDKENLSGADEVLDEISARFESEQADARRRTLWLTLIPVAVGVLVVAAAWMGVSAARDNLAAAEERLAGLERDSQALKDENDALRTEQESLQERIDTRRAELENLALLLKEGETDLARQTAQEELSKEERLSSRWLGEASFASRAGSGNKQYVVATLPNGLELTLGQKFGKGLFRQGTQRPKDYIEASRARLSAAGLTESEMNVMISLAENLANLDSLNSWDNAFLSFGLMQWIAGAGGSRGGLPALLQRIKDEAPETFQEYWGQFGLDVVDLKPDEWQTSGPLFGRFSLDGVTLKSPEQKEALRQDPAWFLRFFLAVEDERVKAMQIVHAIRRLDEFYDTDSYTAGGYRVSQLVTSEYGVSLILDNHVNRPAYVKQCLEKALTRTGLGDPSAWGDEEERRLIEAYLEIRVGHGSSPMTSALERARLTRKYLDQGVISDHRGSFRSGAG